MSIRVCGPKSERLINFIARPLVGGMVMNHDDSAFNRHPNPVRGCAESVNWNLKGAGISRHFFEDFVPRKGAFSLRSPPPGPPMGEAGHGEQGTPQATAHASRR